ncbi:hypothetical protein MBLNU230_g1925t1 [Neophaeotheca triangularis]
MPDNWRDIAARKQQERSARIPKEWRLEQSSLKDRLPISVPRECGLLSGNELAITENHDATSLLEALASGKLKSLDVTTAFCKRAAIAQQTTNCLTEIFFEEAITRAKELDTIYARTGKPTGPLHGLPISIKDSFMVTGYDTSIGIASLCYNPAKENSALVRMLLSMGAVLYCKTNVPQTLMALDSHNNVFGRVVNPSFPHLTPGGSSGGEGALVAMRGSPLGVGTDVGGSIRIPAFCNGLYGVKPSHGRVPYAGQESGQLPGSGRLAIESVAGPIALSMRDCSMFLRIVSNAAPWLMDPDCLPQSWHQQPSLPSSQPLRIGVIQTDGLTTPLPPITNLLNDITTQLTKTPSQQIQLIPLDLAPLLTRTLKLFNALVSLEGYNHIFSLLNKTSEPLSPWLAQRLKSRPAKPLETVRDLQAQKTDLQTAALQIWTSPNPFATSASLSKTPIDLFICPVAPHPVPGVDEWNTVSYTSAFNLLDLPSGVLPLRAVTERDLQAEMPEGNVLNAWDKYNRGLWSGGEAKRRRFLGASMGVQVVGPRLAERRVCEGMEVLERALAGLGARGSRL